jgi:broad specificity phosphatase PhoE
MRAGGFPAPDDELDAAGLRAAAALGHGEAAGVLLTSPATAARQTAEALGPARVDTALRDQDYGDWTGLGFDANPQDALADWLADPAAGAPGGEPLKAVAERLRPWLEARAAEGGAVVAVTHPMLIRTALAVALDAPLEVTLRIGVGPLTQVRLSFNRLWRLQAVVPAKHEAGCGAAARG